MKKLGFCKTKAAAPSIQLDQMQKHVTGGQNTGVYSKSGLNQVLTTRKEQKDKTQTTTNCWMVPTPSTLPFFADENRDKRFEKHRSNGKESIFGKK